MSFWQIYPFQGGIFGDFAYPSFGGLLLMSCVFMAILIASLILARKYGDIETPREY